MRRFASASLLAALTAAAVIPIACGASSSETTSPGQGGTGTGAGGKATGAGGQTSSGGGDIFSGGGGGPVQKLAIKPPSATIDVQNGTSTPISFQAFIGGSMVNPTSWNVDMSSIATVDANGGVAATNAQGGEVILTAILNGQKATAAVTVNLHRLVNPGSVSGPDQSTLNAAVNPDAGITWQYPYDKTVFPKGLLAPELMWAGGGVDDQYAVHLVGKYVDFEMFTKAPTPSQVVLDEQSWKELTESGKGGPVKLTVTRLPAGQAAAAVVINHTWTIANGSLRGTVYYWANNLGRVLRIKPGEAAPDDFTKGTAAEGCSTCHAVSANGSTLIIGGDVGVSTFDLLTNAPVYTTPTVRNWAMAAISPNAKFLVQNHAPLPGPPGGADGDAMWDPTTGTKLGGTGLDGIFLDMPAFGPSATKLAYVDHGDLSLGIYDFDQPGGKVANPVKLVDLGADASQQIAFPSVSPDAKWVVYHRGSLDTRFGPGDLFLASVDQPGLEIPLDELNGKLYPFAAGDRDRHYNYEPTFAPLNSGGYAWVVFTSRRTYGNILTGSAYTGTPDGTKQLWVAAIDQSPVPGAEPSHPAFRVPGQSTDWNMRGFWSLDPCKQIGAMCGTGSECCNQNCVSGVCKDPTPNTCAADGNACMVSADCCDKGSQCINGICSAPPPG